MNCITGKCHLPCLRCPRNTEKKNFGSNRNKPKQDLFRLCFSMFRDTKFFVCLIRFVSVFQSYIETTKLFQNKQKQLEIPKYALYQTDQVGLLFVSVQSKHRNSLFRYRSETKTVLKQTETTWNFLENTKICSLSNQNSLFWYRSETTETNGFFSDCAENSFGSSFGCFESKLVSKNTIISVNILTVHFGIHRRCNSVGALTL